MRMRRVDSIDTLHSEPIRTVNIPWPHSDEYLDTLARIDGLHSFENGIFYYLGTLGGERQWVNPCGIDWLKVKADRSSEGYGRAETLLENKFPLDGWTSDESNAWWEVDIGVGRSARVDHYTLRHGSRQEDNHALSWRLMGTNDGWGKGASRKWYNLHITFGETVLRRRNDGQREYGIGTWKVDPRFDKNEHPFYRYIRVEQLANNQSGNEVFALSGLELYGELMMDMQHFELKTRRHLAACAIQGVVRQMLSKDIFAETRRRFRTRNRAAKRIQKFVRTVNQRLSSKMKRLRDFVKQMRLDSAILIQRWIRTMWSQHVATVALFSALKKNRAALMIQNAFRGYLAFIEMNTAKFAFMRIVAERKRLDEVKEFRRKALAQQREKQMAAWITLNSSATTLQKAVRQLKARRKGKAFLAEKKVTVEGAKQAIAVEVSLRASSGFHQGRADRLALMMEEEEAEAAEEAAEEDSLGEFKYTGEAKPEVEVHAATEEQGLLSATV
jgi:hypothetical protein